MIAYIEGTVHALDSAHVVLLAQGVGYQVELPRRVLESLVLGQTLAVWVHQIIREDADDLYGFLDVQDRDAFRLMLKAPQVGPKLSLAILDAFTARQLARIGMLGEARDLLHVKGLGSKLAERLIVDLKSWAHKGLLPDHPETSFEGPVSETAREAVSALLQLGYKEAQVRRVLKTLPPSSTEDLVRQALKVLSAEKL